jgi:hypothetical protein
VTPPEKPEQALSYRSVEHMDPESKTSSYDIEKEGQVQQLRW